MSPGAGPNLPVHELRAAAARADVLEAMRAFYQEADAEIAARSPTCWNRGLCCNFGGYGHRLYVTTLEVAYYLGAGDLTRGAASAAGPAELGSDGCPDARGGICHARGRRPLGCRIFFCDPAAQFWQGPMTEEWLVRLRRLHEELQVPYFYADWMHVLRELARS